MKLPAVPPAAADGAKAVAPSSATCHTEKQQEQNDKANHRSDKRAADKVSAESLHTVEKTIAGKVLAYRELGLTHGLPVVGDKHLTHLVPRLNRSFKLTNTS